MTKQMRMHRRRHTGRPRDCVIHAGYSTRAIGGQTAAWIRRASGLPPHAEQLPHLGSLVRKRVSEPRRALTTKRRLAWQEARRADRNAQRSLG
jgi:hypothetical protein